MYFIIEIQTTKQGSAIAPIPGYDNKDKAISGYYYKCVFASDPDLSKCDIHTVMLIDNLGEVIMKDVFAHEIPEPEPTPEPEPDEPIDGEPVEEVVEEPSEEPVAEEPIDEPIEEEPVEEESIEEPEEEEPIEEPEEEIGETEGDTNDL